MSTLHFQRRILSTLHVQSYGFGYPAFSIIWVLNTMHFQRVLTTYLFSIILVLTTMTKMDRMGFDTNIFINCNKMVIKIYDLDYSIILVEGILTTLSFWSRGFWLPYHFGRGDFDYYVIFRVRGFWLRGFWHTLIWKSTSISACTSVNAD